jgi:hypothetical protein
MTQIGAHDDRHRLTCRLRQIGGSACVLAGRTRHSRHTIDRHHLEAKPSTQYRLDWLLEIHGSLVEVLVEAASSGDAGAHHAAAGAIWGMTALVFAGAACEIAHNALPRKRQATCPTRTPEASALPAAGEHLDDAGKIGLQEKVIEASLKAAADA